MEENFSFSANLWDLLDIATDVKVNRNAFDGKLIGSLICTVIL